MISYLFIISTFPPHATSLVFALFAAKLSGRVTFIALPDKPIETSFIFRFNYGESLATNDNLLYHTRFTDFLGIERLNKRPPEIYTHKGLKMKAFVGSLCGRGNSFVQPEISVVNCYNLSDKRRFANLDRLIIDMIGLC